MKGRESKVSAGGDKERGDRRYYCWEKVNGRRNAGCGMVDNISEFSAVGSNGKV